MDRLVVNARVLTMDSAVPSADAFAIIGTRIAAAGDSAVLLAQRTRETEILDLGGRTVVPGFVDAHTHFGPLTLAPYEVDLTDPPVPDIPTLQQRLATAARAIPAGAWVRAFGYNDATLAERRHPTRWELDEAAPDHPVCLVHFSYHRLVANSRALELAHIRTNPPQVPGGVIHCDHAGEPAGLLTEAATNPVIQGAIDAVMERPEAELFDLVEANARRHLAAGVTAVQDAWVSPAFLQLFRRAAEAGRLPIYFSPLRGHDQGLFGTPAPWLEPGAIEVDLPPRLRRGGIKLFASGVWEGIHFYTQEELNDLVERAHRQGLTVAIHVSSDRGNELAITAAEHARRAVPGGSGRIRLEHFFWGTASDIDRLAAIGAGVVTQPVALYERGDLASTRISAAPQSSRYPIAQLRAAGVEVGGSSDAPCFGMPPLWGIGAAVDRRSRGGLSLAPEQAVSVEEALRMHTLGAAWAGGTDDIEGSITPGKLANFVVLAEDPTAVAPGRIRDITVDETWIDGVRAYQRVDATA